jgi:oxazoline/thiazoline dehydrogenase
LKRKDVIHMSTVSIAERGFSESSSLSLNWVSLVRLRLADGIRLTHERGETWSLSDGEARRSFRVPGRELSECFLQLQSDGVSLKTFLARSSEVVEPLSVVGQISRLWRYGLIVQELIAENYVAATFTVRNGVSLFPPALDAERAFDLSEDFFVRPESRSLLIESLSCGARIVLYNQELFPVPLSFMRKTSVREAARYAGCPIEWVMTIASWLTTMIGPGCEPAVSQPVKGWTFADQLLHARSRGRHVGKYGAAYPLRGVMAAPPAVRPKRETSVIQLPRIDANKIGANDPPFGTVLESRRSLRNHAENPMSIAQLGEFLYRCARIKEQFAGGGLEYAKRPYPSGGGLYETEFYPLVSRCQGLEPSLDRYNGVEHSLEHVCRPNASTQAMLQMAVQATGIDCRPHVLIVLAARFQRVFWKYESMAYALVLKNVGVIYQTMYLVATAMGLAASALGGGDAEAFCRAAGTSFWEESSVGEFILGKPAETEVFKPSPAAAAGNGGQP